VHSWLGPRDIEREHPTILINGAVITGASHAV
jgi:hypothetical protein